MGKKEHVDALRIAVDSVPGRRLSAQATYLDSHGREQPDPTPMAPPIGYNRQPSLAERIRAMVVSEKLKQEAIEAGFETFEESDDFDVGDDYDPTSPYEEVFEPPLPPEPVEVRVRPEPVDPTPPTPEAAPVAPVAT